MAKARILRQRERETVERTIKALLSDCIAREGDLIPSNADYAEAHGVYRTLKALDFDGADSLWHNLQRWAVETVKGKGEYCGAYSGPQYRSNVERNHA